jgi:hypothetical protein
MKIKKISQLPTRQLIQYSGTKAEYKINITPKYKNLQTTIVKLF